MARILLLLILLLLASLFAGLWFLWPPFKPWTQGEYAAYRTRKEFDVLYKYERAGMIRFTEPTQNPL